MDLRSGLEDRADARSGLQKLRDRLWGYDFFISYHWASGGVYATALAERLRDQRFEVFLDRAEFAAGDDWKREARWALRSTQRLVVVATREAVTASEPVAMEVVNFSGRGRHIVTIVFDSLADIDRDTSRVLRRIPRTQLHVLESAERLSDGPSDDAIKQLVSTHHVLRRRRLRARIIASVICALSLLAIAATSAAIVAKQQRNTAVLRTRIATSRQLAAEGRDRIDRNLGLAALLGAAALEAYPTAEASNLLTMVARERRGLQGFLPFNQGHVVKAVASPNAGMLAVAYEAPATGSKSQASWGVFRWDLKSRRPIQEFEARDGRFAGLEITRDGGALVVAFHRDGKWHSGVRLWDLKKHDWRGPTWEVPEGLIRDLAISQNGTTLAAGIHRAGGVYDPQVGSVVVWDLVAGKRLGDPIEVSDGPVSGVSLDRSGETVAAMYLDTSFGLTRSGILVQGVDGSRPREINPRPISFLDEFFSEVALAPDGKTLAAAVGFQAMYGEPTSAGRVATWKLGDGTTIEPTYWSLPGGSVTRLRFSPDGETLAAAFEPSPGELTSGVALWELKDEGGAPSVLAVPEGPVSDVAFESDGPTLAAAYGTGVVLWDLSALEAQARTVYIHPGGVRSVRYLSDGQTIAVGWGDADARAPMPSGNVRTARGGIGLWDSATSGPTRAPLDVAEGDVRDLAISPDGGTLAAACVDFGEARRSGVLLYDLPGLVRRGPFIAVDEGAVTSVAFSPDGSTLAAAYLPPKGGVAFWNVKSGERLKPDILEQSGPIWDIAFRPRGMMLTMALEQAVACWDWPQRRRIITFPVDEGRVNEISFSPDGRTIAAAFGAGQDGGVILWDMEAEPRTRIGPVLRVEGLPAGAVAFDPAGKTLAAGFTRFGFLNEAPRGAVALWDLNSLQLVGPPHVVEGGGVVSLAFGEEGRVLAAGFVEPGPEGLPSGGFTFTHGGLGALQERAREIANRNFTQTEWRQFFPGEEYRRVFDDLPDGR